MAAEVIDRERMRTRRLSMLKALTEMRELNTLDKLVTALREIKSDGLLELQREIRKKNPNPTAHGFIETYVAEALESNVERFEEHLADL